MSGQEDKAPVSFGDPATEPVDLAQAFKMYNEANREAAQQPVEAGEPDDPVEASGSEGGQQDGGEVAGGDVVVDDTAAAAADDASGGGVGGSANVIEPVDYDARRKQILQGIQQQALNQVRKDFSDNKITPCTIEDLYQRDEQTGRVTFKNPDDPSRDFASRAEAQLWVDAFNKQIEMRFRQEVNKKQRDLVDQSAPMLRLIDFIPKYEAMNQQEKDVLDKLIEPYGVKNASGDVIGYSVNLDAMANQAKNIASMFATAPQGSQETQEAEEGKQESSRPAMNMPTGNGESKEDKEPKTLGEAMAMLNKSKKGGK